MSSKPPSIQIAPGPFSASAAGLPAVGAALAPDAIVPNQVDATFRTFTTALGKTVPANITRARLYIDRMHKAGR